MLGEVDSFISKRKAAAIIKKCNGLFEPAGVFAQQNNGYRVAEKVMLSRKDPLISDILEGLSELTEMPLENQERPQVIRYPQGGEYKPHYDFFPPGMKHYDDVMRNGGQRLFSCLIYLNENFEGGETSFNSHNVIIKPKTGKLIIWDNANANNDLNYQSLHAGLPVLKGEKYILIVWVRAKNYVENKN